MTEPPNTISIHCTDEHYITHQFLHFQGESWLQHKNMSLAELINFQEHKNINLLNLDINTHNIDYVK